MSGYRPRSSGGGGIASVVAGSNINVDNTDPANPVINMPLPIQVPVNTTVVSNSDFSAAVMAIDGNGNPVMKDVTGGATFSFVAGPNPKASGANIPADGTTTPVTSVTLGAGFIQAVS